MSKIKNLLENFIPYVRHMKYKCMDVNGYFVDWDNDINWFNEWISINWYYLVSRLYSSNPSIIIDDYTGGYYPKFYGLIGNSTHRVNAEFKGVKYRVVDFIFKKDDEFQQCYILIGRNIKDGIDGDYREVKFEQLAFFVEPINVEY